MGIRAPRDSEWATRKTLIDKRLRGAGWRITPFDPTKTLESWDRCAVEEYQTGNRPADYALILGDRVVGVVGAKKLTLGPQNVLVQAERYAGGLFQDGFGWGSFGVPFLYSTNGEVIWYEDVRVERYRSRQLAGFHTPGALAEFLGRDVSGACARALAMPQSNVRLRDYQAYTQLREHVHGATRPRVNTTQLRTLSIRICPFIEQKEIVRRVNVLFAVADKITARYERARTHVNKLTQSILAKAFRGELVLTEAELARHEGRDFESAAQMLDRVKNVTSTPVASQTVKRRAPTGSRSRSKAFI